MSKDARTIQRNEDHRLLIGGVDAKLLAEQYGTPLFAYDTGQIREKARAFKKAFEDAEVRYQVAYASKAFSSIAMFELVNEEGLSLDVVSGGELYTAKMAGFPMEKIHFHGNNKSRQEICEALDAGIGCFVVDNFHELDLLAEESAERSIRARVLLRVTPGVSAHTHAYISTGQEDSKFGFDLQGGQAEQALKIACDDSSIELLGFHCHIGSQIFETSGFTHAVSALYEHIRIWNDKYDYQPEVINTGGGFGIRYVEEDKPLSPETFVEAVITAVKKESEQLELPLPEIWIEPGRSIVGEAGTSLYTIGSEKKIEGVRHYVSVDGGMADNIRPALYGAEYEAVLVDQPHEERNDQNTYAIAGKACESGDMLIQEIALPQVRSGELLAMLSTGAYGYSMASNYNRLPRPAVVFAEEGRHQLIIERESYQDLVRLDRSLYNG